MTKSTFVATAGALNGTGAYKTILTANHYTLIADEPTAVGGNDEGPSPGDFVCMSLASCKAITLRMYVQRKQWEVGEINVKVALVRTDDTTGAVHSFACEIAVAGDITEEQKQRLVQIAKACPISKLLSKGSTVTIIIK